MVGLWGISGRVGIWGRWSRLLLPRNLASDCIWHSCISWHRRVQPYIDWTLSSVTPTWNQLHRVDSTRLPRKMGKRRHKAIASSYLKVLSPLYFISLIGRQTVVHNSIQTLTSIYFEGHNFRDACPGRTSQGHRRQWNTFTEEPFH
jgi:hypothetical protein